MIPILISYSFTTVYYNIWLHVHVSGMIIVYTKKNCAKQMSIDVKENGCQMKNILSLKTS